MTNVIADVAGQYKALVKLVDKMPDGEIISLGDMVDRGPDSQKVLDFFMESGRRAVLGNHEHMMLDYLRQGKFYDRRLWIYNGGSETLKSFDPSFERSPSEVVPQKYLEWIDGLPKFIEIDNCLLSHSFLRGYMSSDEALKHCCEFGETVYDKDETTIVWNRQEPVRRDKWRLQVCGHNSQFGLRKWEDKEGEYAICLDDSAKKVLTGMVLETGEVFQQEYVS